MFWVLEKNFRGYAVQYFGPFPAMVGEIYEN